MISLDLQILGGRGASFKKESKAGDPYSKEGIATLENYGATRWQKYGRDRLYVRRLRDLLGIEIDRHNSGNIRKATLDGEVISNARARRLLDSLDGAYVDLNGKKIVVEGREEDRDYITKKVMELVK